MKDGLKPLHNTVDIMFSVEDNVFVKMPNSPLPSPLIFLFLKCQSYM